MDKYRRDLMIKRSEALAHGDIPRFQELTRQIADLPLKGVKSLTTADVNRYVSRPQK